MCSETNTDSKGNNNSEFILHMIAEISSANGASIHLSGKGVPTIVIGIPVRYAHTHYGISAYADFEGGVKLACEILRNMNAELISRF